MSDRREELVRRMVAEGTSDDDIRATLKAFDAQNTPSAAAERTWTDTARDVGTGIVKGAASTVAGLGEMAANAGLIPGVMPAALSPAMRNPAFTRAEELTKPANDAQAVGKGIEMVAELALPVTKGVQAIPRVSRASEGFQDVMAAAKNIPIDITEPGNAALQVMRLAEHGGTMPRAVTQFLRRVTDPEKGPLTYEDARLFASNISRLSADEFGRLTPVMQREIANVRVALNKAVADAAGKAGKGREYAQAMTEYARAMKIRNTVDQFVEGAKRGLPWATGIGAGGYVARKIWGLNGAE